MESWTWCICSGVICSNVTLWYLRNGMQKFTFVILYMNIRCIAYWLADANFEISHCSYSFARCHTQTLKNIFKQTRVDFYRENMTSFLNYITASLRAFCVTWLICKILLYKVVLCSVINAILLLFWKRDNNDEALYPVSSVKFICSNNDTG